MRYYELLQSATPVKKQPFSFRCREANSPLNKKEDLRLLKLNVFTFASLKHSSSLAIHIQILLSTIRAGGH